MRSSVLGGFAVAAAFIASPALAQDTADSAAWGRCLGTEVGRLAGGNAAPADIADSAMRSCRAQETRARAALARAGSTPAETEAFVRKMRNDMRELAITTRAQMGRTQVASRPAPPRARPPARPPSRQAAPPARTGQRFSLVNHYNSPVVRFHAANSNGSWSKNWLNTQVAPYDTRNLQFNQQVGCSRRVMIVFADQSVAEDRVNLCGATYLNTDGIEMWVE